MKLSVVIQAGGESRRMGSNKALIMFKGQPLILRVAQRLQPLADEVLVTTNQTEGLAFLHLPLIPDMLPGKGALGGLFSALNAARNELVAVVACDMPFISTGLIHGEAELLAGSEWDAVVPLSDEGLPEPLSAVYRRSTCLPAVRRALEAGEMRLVSWFSQVNVRLLDEKESSHFHPGKYLFYNINTPEDLDLAEQLDRGSEPS